MRDSGEKLQQNHDIPVGTREDLNCLYDVETILKDYNSDLDSLFRKLIVVIQTGWQLNGLLGVRIRFDSLEVLSADFAETGFKQEEAICIGNEQRGGIELFYAGNCSNDKKKLIPQGKKLLLKSIVWHLSLYLVHRHLLEIVGGRIKFNGLVEKLKRKNGKISDTLRDKAIGKILEYLECPEEPVLILSADAENHWQWRYRMAECIASRLDPQRFGVKNIYIFGSTKNASAGPASDIDLLIHFSGNSSQRKQLVAWLDGWSLCLAEINYLKTGCKTEGLLDYHLITDHDIEQETSFAIKINAVTDGARPLKMGEI
ncbi:MAG: nucleotidyltransferase domain-containing protein [Candidatus Cloacimonetes bacterium]|nr:nucleotidyltransferase domain-containing protein [Candidatus Cloacimonadota bacterium]